MRILVLRSAVLAATAAATIGTGGSAFAASATANASATIVQAITISSTEDLSFGTIAPSAAGGNVVVDSADTRTTCAGGNFCSGTVTSAAFEVSGEANYNYSITLPATNATLSSSGNTMTVSSFTSSASATPALGATGTDTFKVGATLAVGGGQAAGTYTGTFDVSVDYQ